MSLVSFFFHLARLSADAKALGSGDTKRVARRAKNKIVGRWRSSSADPARLRRFAGIVGPKETGWRLERWLDQS